MEKFASTIDGSCIKEIGLKNPIVGVVQKFPLASELEVTKMFLKPEIDIHVIKS